MIQINDAINKAKGELHAIEKHRGSHDKTNKDFILKGEVHKIIDDIKSNLKEIKEMTHDELIDELVYRMQEDGVDALIKPYPDIKVEINITKKTLTKNGGIKMSEEQKEEAVETTEEVEETKEEAETEVEAKDESKDESDVEEDEDAEDEASDDDSEE